MKKHLLLIVTLLLISVSGIAQGYVYFGYDANGNRISRSIFFGKAAQNDKNTMTEDELVSEIKSEIGGMEFSLYPNPNRGHFSVSLGDSEGQTPLRVVLFTQSGEVLTDKTLNGNVAEFDLSNQSAGFYLLKLTVREETQIWKVVKY